MTGGCGMTEERKSCAKFMITTNGAVDFHYPAVYAPNLFSFNALASIKLIASLA